MCGIVGYTGYRNAAEVVLGGLTTLEYRGYDSAGIALGGTPVSVTKCGGRVSALRAMLPDREATSAIGHTRWATHGAPSGTNAHPHLSEDGRIAVVHNGVIENNAELKAELQSRGVRFSSDTDSEIIAHLIALDEHDDMRERIAAAASRIDGAATFLAIAEGDDRIFCHKRGAALLVARTDGESFVASDMLALAPYTDRAVVMRDGETAVLSPSEIELYSDGKRLTSRSAEKLRVNPPSVCPCYMRAEIADIPEALIATYLSFEKAFKKTNARVVDRLKKCRRALIVGCGTAYHAGLYGKEVLENYAEIPTEVVVASEIDRARFIDEDTFAVFISQSGETADTLAALGKCKERGAFTLALTNSPASSITFAADSTLLLDAGAEIAVAATKSFNCQLLALYLLAKSAAGERVEPHSVRNLSIAARSLISKPLFEPYVASSNLFFVGKGIDEITAKEGALKFKEITYKMTDAYAAGELKHGTIALIDSSSTVIVAATCKRDKKRIESSVAELKSRGARLIGISAVGDIGCDVTLNLPALDEECLYPVLAVIPLQLIALACACHLGLDPDKPRNLAKSVTVI